jgi:protein-tyrosine phosphatase
MTHGRTEIHFHLLPGLDDGPATVADALALAHAAALDGTSTIVATPHIRSDYVTDVGELRDRVRAVKEALAREAIPVSVLSGGELGHDMVGRLRQDELDAIAQGPPRRRWLLLETPFEGLARDFRAAADELRDRGFGLVLAHPERSAGLLGEHRDALDHELAAGTALQVNAFSLLGLHGDYARRTALRLVRLDLATAIASDAHGGVRAPALTRALEAARAEGVPNGVMRRLVDSAPRRLLARGVEPMPAARLR